MQKLSTNNWTRNVLFLLACGELTAMRLFNNWTRNVLFLLACGELTAMRLFSLIFADWLLKGKPDTVMTLSVYS